jgi:nucleoside-diphosphate-sugar epimerase
MPRKLAAIVGFGDIGARLAPRLTAAGWECAGLRRNVQRLPAGVEPVAADFTDASTLSVLREMQPDLLLFTPTPTDYSPAGYEAAFAAAAGNILAGLDGHQPRHVFLVSSTRVYAERDGGEVDETAPLTRSDASAQAIIEAERCFLDHCPGAAVLRAGGLYGDGPGQLLRRVAAGHVSATGPPRYSNRLHRDDLAGFIHYLAEHGHSEGIYNAVDDAPVPLQEVERWLSEQLGKPYRPASDAETGGRGHKRVSNARLRDSGYQLHYPDFRSGYAEVLRRWLAHSEREDSLDLH